MRSATDSAFALADRVVGELRLMLGDRCYAEVEASGVITFTIGTDLKSCGVIAAPWDWVDGTDTLPFWRIDVFDRCKRCIGTYDTQIDGRERDARTIALGLLAAWGKNT